ncbi:hypothetical protein COX09_00085 [Candidatus Beckwithbacteria bacterium CG23_combo_of_CG06-09_8_20_14_all_47_9]|uniref:Mannosyl-glycoprotein endo-beta-N-acetylglucosamidase-like domain-containing protein n=2 Tax=Candidatus Beckwithiibacteriota TaxID=1752726 RepID=A0A2H0B703_9BACT|nr:MAG: hypothetical protein COX09_00085 [Candidatus Beckwithbacteria bacterium CG23_combo_of_CG06-09_8_20_14_all_47_9]PJC66789.1 MAG: hypothetical protein CO018_00100 [Candidatus Beckwithbacteria bacterium CG_4_9_14_0_2_um_filter_47_11]
MKRLSLVLGWWLTANLVLAISLMSYFKLNRLATVSLRPQANRLVTEAVSSHAVNPQVLGALSYQVKTEDAVPEIIKAYLAKYNSPLLPHADYLVNAARSYRIDPRLLVAIAQQESNLCKKIPDDSFNCWGWGIHSRGTLGFASYEEAIDAVVKGLAKNYFGEGLTTPEAIMGIYTPLSDGSWARGVQQFIDQMK